MTPPALRTREANQARAASRVRGAPRWVLPALGALSGALLGVLIEWGLAVLMRRPLGAAVILVGYLAGRGAAIGSIRYSRRRARMLSLAATLLWVPLGSYWANAHSLPHSMRAPGESVRLSFPPESFHAFVDHAMGDLGGAYWVFAAIALWVSWLAVPSTCPPKHAIASTGGPDDGRSVRRRANDQGWTG